MCKETDFTSELPLSSLPDFLHNSSEEKVDSDTFEAPLAGLVQFSIFQGASEYQV